MTAGSFVVKEANGTTGDVFWSKTLTLQGNSTRLLHLPVVDALFLSSDRSYGGTKTLQKLNASNGDVLGQADTGAIINDLFETRDGTLLASGVSGSDGIAVSTLREFDTNLNVLWRFDSNFISELKGAVEDFVNPPTIETESSGGTFEPGETVDFYVTASGTEPLEYQWYKDEEIIPEAIGPNYSFTAQKSNPGTYYCIVSNDYGQDQSSDMVLIVQYAPEFISQSGPTTASVGVHTTLFVVVDALPAATYRWYKNGNLIPGAITSIYEFFAGDQDAGTYTCVASNVVGDAESSPIVVTVVRNPYHYNAFNRQIDQDRV